MGKSGINIEVPKFELNKMIKDFDKYAKHKKDEISTQIEGTLKKILSDATSSVPHKTGSLITSGNTEYSKNDLEGSVSFNKNYAAYVEFGTGKKTFISSFKFTNAMKSYASNFKGANQDHAGIKSRPYLFPAFVDNTKDLVSKIQKLLSKK